MNPQGSMRQLSAFVMSTLTFVPKVQGEQRTSTRFILHTPLLRSLGKKKGAAKGAAPNKYHHWEVEEVCSDWMLVATCRKLDKYISEDKYISQV